jgi:MFS family permease
MSAEIVSAEPDADHILPVGYLELIRANPNFRTLWFGQIVSELGDWLSTVALLNLMLELTGRAQVVGWYFIIIHLPGVLVGPFSGVLVDRLDRKKIMIVMDLVRATLVLGYLLVQRADQIWILYLVAALGVTMMTLFEPARTASLPNICGSGELVPANALSSITWSIMLALGAALGGFVAAAFGRNVCYVVDAASFVLSALLISRVRLPRHNPSVTPAMTVMSGFQDILRGFQYLKRNVRVFFLLLVKTGWGLGGGVLLVLSVFGETIFPVMGSGAAGIGVLYAARGIGAGLGPVFARRISGQSRRSMRTAIGAGFFLSCVFYILFGYSPILPIAVTALLVAHMGGSITWVFSSVLLQLEIPDEFRGRVFAIEFALLTLGVAISNYAAGYLLDILDVNPRTVAVLLGLYFAIPGVLWFAAQRLYRR